MTCAQDNENQSSDETYKSKEDFCFCVFVFNVLLAQRCSCFPSCCSLLERDGCRLSLLERNELLCLDCTGDRAEVLPV